MRSIHQVTPNLRVMKNAVMKNALSRRRIGQKELGTRRHATRRSQTIVHMNDPYNLQRFVDAQNSVYEQVRSELRGGRKRTHWMWFIFPQIRGLGRSHMAEAFAIASKDEAAAYVSHSVLGPRLRECTEWVTEVEGRTLEEILGYHDNLKFRSSMTLFAQATADNQLFVAALRKYCNGEPDPATLRRLAPPA
jgi:uncharacterized protein (DUF1810 family)